MQTLTSEVIGWETLATGDFDGDGRSDVAVIADDASREHRWLFVLFSERDGHLAAPVELEGGRTWSLAVADFDGDGRVDLATRSSPTDARLFLSRRGRRFEAREIHVAGVSSLATGDLNHDGRTDLVVGAGGGEGLSIHLVMNQGAGDFGWPGELSFGHTGKGGTNPLLADFDGDGQVDVALLNTGPDERSPRDDGVNVLYLDRRLSLAGSTRITTGPRWRQFAAADLNRDGRSDLVVTTYNLERSYFSVLLNQGGRDRWRRTDYAPVGNIALADFDRDGWIDVAMGWCDLLLYRNLGDGSLAPAQLIQHRPYGGAATAAADVDGDGRADIVFTLRSPGMTTIGVMLNRTP